MFDTDTGGIDSSRTRIPVSATVIRENAYAYRHFLHETVYRDLITTMFFIEAVSSGKTTITDACARKHTTAFAQKYGCEYCEKYQIDSRVSRCHR